MRAGGGTSPFTARGRQFGNWLAGICSLNRLRSPTRGPRRPRSACAPVSVHAFMANASAEQVAQELDRRALADAIDARRERRDGLDARTEPPPRHARGQGGPGDAPAAAARERVQTVFGDVRFDRRQLPDVVQAGRGVASGQRALASFARRRLDHDAFVDLVRWRQGAFVLGVARLPAWLAACRLVRPLRLLRPVARRRLRRALRRAPEQFFEVRRATLELGDACVTLGELAFQLRDPCVPPIHHAPLSVDERGAASSRERNHATNVQAPRDALFQTRA